MTAAPKGCAWLLSGSIADRSNFMSDCKQMQVRLKNGMRYINLERKKYQANLKWV